MIESTPQAATIPAWLEQVAEWLTRKTPRDFGYFRTRWSCAALAETLAWETGVRLSGDATMHAALAEIPGFIASRIRDPQKERCDILIGLGNMFARSPQKSPVLARTIWLGAINPNE